MKTRRTHGLNEKELDLVKLLMADCETTGDIQARLKRLFAGTIEQMLEAALVLPRFIRLKDSDEEKAAKKLAALHRISCSLRWGSPSHGLCSLSIALFGCNFSIGLLWLINAFTQFCFQNHQGFQYTSHQYFRLTQSYDITPSMSRRGNPYDNALAENFFSILKTECIYRVKLKSFEEARLLIDDYIYFYNHQRIQSKTKLTPLELRSQFVA